MGEIQRCDWPVSGARYTQQHARCWMEYVTWAPQDGTWAPLDFQAYREIMLGSFNVCCGPQVSVNNSLVIAL